MKFQILAAAFAASAAAAPSLRTRQTNSTIGDNQPFGLVAIRSGSPIQYTSFSASQNNLFVDLPAQNATCTSDGVDFATFYLSGGALYLLTPDDITQELYTDLSGMGQGVLQYATTPGGSQPGRNSQTVGWQIDETGDLNFDGSSLLACPGFTDGAWSVWVSAGIDSPAGNTGCLSIAARAIASDAPDACTYTYTPVTA